MRCLYTLTAYPPFIGGAQLHHHLLGQEMLRKHAVQVVCHWNKNRTDWLLGTTLNAPMIPQDYYIDNIPVHRLGLKISEKFYLAPILPLYYPLMRIALPIIAGVIAKHLEIFADRVDLVHNVRIGREGLSYASLKMARKYDIPFVLTAVHHPRWVGWRYREYLKLYQQADAVIALTKAEKEVLIGLGVKEERIHITGIGPILAEKAEPQVFIQRYQIEEPIILFLGQHYPYKGYRQLLEAMPMVWKKFPEANFVFIGPPVAQSEKDFARLQDRRVHRLGTVDLQEKTNALAACTLLCVPSNQESFGGVYTEAWSFAKPVIGCNIPAVSDVITHGIDGYLISQNFNEIADRICQILSNTTQAQAMGEAGKNKVKQNYTWDKLAEKTEFIYKKLLG
ncbi:glycosyltransferase family 4 protein [Altericista sp. CCNU0014]|uniref:glycosyltransferase family 4 protein n=1 Tax=Altericista sp. CCNU0014 TaxID=3082949 RepID=UPI00384F711C